MRFSDLGELAQQFQRMGAGFVADKVQKIATEAGARVICDYARSLPGTYQEGWPELADATKETRRRLGFSENEPLLRTHELANSYYVEREGDKVFIGSPLLKAGVMETGDPVHNVPARPVLGLAMVQAEEAGFKALEDVAAALVDVHVLLAIPTAMRRASRYKVRER